MRRPLVIQFESSTACNLMCLFCPRYDMTRPMGMMSDDLFYKIIKEGKEMGVNLYAPFLNGEPFIFPRIWEWLDYMEKEGVRVILYTNGEYLDVDRVIKYKNIYYMNVSFNAATAETYYKVTRSQGDFEATKAKLKDLMTRAPFHVQPSMVVTEDNDHEQKLYKQTWGRRARLRPFLTWTGNRNSTIPKMGKRIPCGDLITHLSILWDGRVCLCCMDYNGQVIVGDINKQSLKEVWESTLTLRERHNKLDFDMPLCRNCNFNTT